MLVTAVLSLKLLATMLVTPTTATHRVQTTEEFEEFYGSVSFADATVGVALSNDYYASTGESTYVYVEYGVELSEDYALGFHYGTMSADDAANEADDYSVSLSTEAAGLGFDLSWIDSSEDWRSVR